MQSGICISSQLCISQGYWNDVTHQSRQPHKQCFSPFVTPLFAQKHSCTTLVGRVRQRAGRGALTPPGPPGLMEPHRATWTSRGKAASRGCGESCEMEMVQACWPAQKSLWKRVDPLGWPCIAFVLSWKAWRWGLAHKPTWTSLGLT